MTTRRVHTVLAAAIASLATAGCAAAQAPADLSTDQAYVIVDFQTPLSGQDVSNALKLYLDRQNVQVTTSRPETPVVPRIPRRFALIDPASPGGFGLQGPSTQTPSGRVSSVRIATCDGASWRADVRQRVASRLEQRYTLCLFPYRDGRKQGHQLDIYATTVLRGGHAGPSRRTAADTTERFMTGAVEAVERLTRSPAVWVENRPSARSRTFPLDDDALAGETH